MLQWDYETKPEKCPLCGSTKIAEIRYGLIRPTPEGKKEIEEGKWVMGGCLMHPALPKWLCKTCNARMYKIRNK
jgi:rubrerythrin